MESEKLIKLIEVLEKEGWNIASFKPLDFGAYELHIEPQKSIKQDS